MSIAIQGLSNEDRVKFRDLVARDFSIETAGSQVGLGPNESQQLARTDRHLIRKRRTRLQYVKPTNGQNPDAKIRRCLVGDHDFYSRGPHERICRDCKGSPEWRDGETTTYSLTV